MLFVKCLTGYAVLQKDEHTNTFSTILVVEIILNSVTIISVVSVSFNYTWFSIFNYTPVYPLLNQAQVLIAKYNETSFRYLT